MRQGITILTFLLLVLNFALANGGNQKVVAEKYVVQLSMAPLVPEAGETTSMIVSVADLQVRPLQERVFLRVRIRLQGKSDVLFDSDEHEVMAGNFDFSYRFPRAGLYEVFVEFRLASAPNVVYRPEDFLISVESRPLPVLPTVGAAFVFGFVVGIILLRRRRHAV